jgi:hypothetical protein
MSNLLLKKIFEQEEEIPNVAIPKAEYDVTIVTKDVDGAEKALNDPKNYGGTFSQDKGELVTLKKIYLAQGMSFIKNSFLKVFKLNNETEEKFIEAAKKDSSLSKYLKQHPDVEDMLGEMYNVLSSEDGKPYGQFYVNSAANAARLDKFTGKTADTLGYEVKGNTITFPKSLNPKMTNNEIKNKVKKVLDGKVEYRFKGSGAPRNLTKIGTSQSKLKEMIREEILKMLK